MGNAIYYGILLIQCLASWLLACLSRSLATQ